MTTTAHITEAQLQKHIEQLCLLNGLLYYHTYDSRRSTPGFPDLVIISASGALFAELKTDTGRLSRTQKAWIDACIASHTPVRIWRPAQWRDGTIQAEISRLATAAGNEPTRGIVRKCATIIREDQAAGAIRRSLHPARH